MKFSLLNRKYTLTVIGLFILLCVFTLIFGHISTYNYFFLGWTVILWFSGNIFGYKGYRMWFDKSFAIIMFLSWIVSFILLKINVPTTIQDNAFKLGFAVFLAGEAIFKQVGLPPDSSPSS